MPTDDPVPSNLLECQNPGLLCKWLCLFVMEIWKSDGSQYPPALRSLLSGVNYVLQKNTAPFSIPVKVIIGSNIFYIHWIACAVTCTGKELRQLRIVPK